MTRTQISIPETLHKQLMRLAQQRGEPMAHVVQGVIKVGLERVQAEKDFGIQVLEKVANLKLRGGPKDLSTNLDHYLYGGPKKSE